MQSKQHVRAISRLKRLGIFALVLLLVVLPFFALYFPNNSKALGGGYLNIVTTITTTNSTTATAAVGTPNNIQGVYFVVLAETFAPNIKVSSISDTVGNTYSLGIQSNHYEDTEIWAKNYTKTNFAANTITVTFNASTESIIRV